MKTRLATWTVAVVWRSLWVLIIGGTISFLLARNHDGIAAAVFLVLTIIVVLAYIANRIWGLARAIDRMQQRGQEREVQRQMQRTQHPQR